MSKKKEYYTPEPEPENRFVPTLVPGVNTDRINWTTQVKNLPTGAQNSAYSAVINVPSGASSITLWFTPLIAFFRDSPVPGNVAIVSTGTDYVYGTQISASLSGNKIVFTNSGGTVTLKVHAISV